MTQPVQVPTQSYVATLGQTVFAFNFYCDDVTALVVLKNTLIQGGYGVALNGDQVAAPGGTVTLVVGAGVGDAVVVKRVSPIQQNTALATYGLFTAASIMLALDKIVRLIQELATGVGTGSGGGGGVGGTLVPNEVPAGLVNSTNGADGNGIFTFLAAPVSPLKFFLYVDGVRQPPNRYVLVGAVATFNAGLNPLTGSDIRGDYYV